MLFNHPVDEVKECIAFFAEKLFFDDNEKKMILSSDGVYNKFIRLSEEC